MTRSSLEPRMVKQIIIYSDGTQKVLTYSGETEDGVLVPDRLEEGEGKTDRNAPY